MTEATNRKGVPVNANDDSAQDARTDSGHPSLSMTVLMTPDMSNFAGNVHGSDPELDPAANPESDPRHLGGERLDLLFGLNFFVPKGKLKGTRLSIEGGFPIHQSLDGPQLKTNWQLNVGLSYTFR